MRLDLFLKKSLLVKSRAKAQDFIEGGSVLLNGRTVKPSHEVKVGDRIETVFRLTKKVYEVQMIPDRGMKQDSIKLIYEGKMDEDRQC